MQGNFALKISLQLLPKFWHLHLINAKDASAPSDNDIHFAEDIFPTRRTWSWYFWIGDVTLCPYSSL